MRIPGRLLAALFVAGAAALFAAGGDVVVLKGGAKVELKKAPERRGNLIFLTRADGTLFSVPDAEVDWKATADLRASRAHSGKSAAPAAAAGPETPAEAARQAKEGPRARVKLTDADVQHVAEESPDSGSAQPEKKGEERGGGARLEVADYVQEKSGTNVIVRGELRNVGGTPAVSSRLTVTAMDDKGEKIASSEAGLSNGLIAAGASVSFSVTIPVGEKISASLRFAPQWIAPAAPAPATTPSAAGAAGSASSRPPAASPTPVPTPYGLGTLYAPNAAPASTTPPADGSGGYIPGMSSPENQPQPIVTPAKPKS